MKLVKRIRVINLKLSVKSLLTKTSKTYLKKLVGKGVLFSLQKQYDNNLEGKACNVLSINKQVEKNNFSAISILSKKVEGIQTCSKNQHRFLLENIQIHLGKLKEIEKSIS